LTGWHITAIVLSLVVPSSPTGGESRVGCGASGLMKVPENIDKLLQEHGIELFTANTNMAVEKFNELAGKGENVAAALHLTC
jgi:hypothetical protein